MAMTSAWMISHFNMIDQPLFLSRAESNLRKAQIELEKYINDFVLKGIEVAEKMKIYRQRRSALLLEAIKSGTSATNAGDIVRGQCAPEKAEYMKANTEYQALRYKIQAMETRMNNIRHISKHIEYQVNKGV